MQQKAEIRCTVCVCVCVYHTSCLQSAICNQLHSCVPQQLAANISDRGPTRQTTPFWIERRHSNFLNQHARLSCACIRFVRAYEAENITSDLVHLWAGIRSSWGTCSVPSSRICPWPSLQGSSSGGGGVLHNSSSSSSSKTCFWKGSRHASPLSVCCASHARA